MFLPCVPMRKRLSTAFVAWTKKEALMLTMMLLLFSEQKPTNLPLPTRPAQLKELANDGSFVSHFQFDKVESHGVMPDHCTNLFQIKAKRDLFKTQRVKEIPT